LAQLVFGRITDLPQHLVVAALDGLIGKIGNQRIALVTKIRIDSLCSLK
jgi:hypothetical protein